MNAPLNKLERDKLANRGREDYSLRPKRDKGVRDPRWVWSWVWSDQAKMWIYAGQTMNFPDKVCFDDRPKGIDPKQAYPVDLEVWR